MADYADCPPVSGNCEVECSFFTRELDCDTDSITVCPPSSGVFDVDVTNEVDIRDLDCETDSITVCPPATGVFDVEVTNEVDIRDLDCSTDSVTVCPPASGVFDVDVTNEVDIRDLNCETDSVTVCPPASGVFDVDVTNEVDIRDLDCSTDSVTVCPPASGVFEVDVTNEVNIRPLSCDTDSVEVCLDQPISVTGSIEIKHPGVPGTIVPGSRWHQTGLATLTGLLTIVSPTPAGNQRVVCDWIDYGLVAAALSLGGGTAQPTIRDGGAGGTIIWQTAFGLIGTIAIGTTYTNDEQLVLLSSAGNQLTYQLPATLAIFDMTLNFGGYIVEV